MMLVWLGQGTYRVHRDSQRTLERSHRIQELRTRVANLTEMLHMSARLAAVTGDARWERRYHELEPIQAAAIQESIGLAPESSEQGVIAQIDSTHRAMVAIQQQVFALSRQARLEEADVVLNSEEYQKQRASQNDGLEKFLSTMGDNARAVQLTRERKALLEYSAAAAAICLLLVLWLAVLKRRRNEQNRLRTARTEELLSSISSILIGVGTDGRITNWNAAAESVFGILAKDTIGHPFRECRIRWEWPTILDAGTTSMDQKRPVRIDTIRFEHPKGGEGVLGVTVNPAAPEARAGTAPDAGGH